MPESDIPYKFIGTAQFSGAVEVRFQHQQGNTLVIVDSRFHGQEPNG
jgi:hypothetical protein